MSNAFDAAEKLERTQLESLNSIKAIKSSLENLDPPPPWQAHFSEKYGRIYYYHPVTKESVWECPAADTCSSELFTSPGAAQLNTHGRQQGSPDRSIASSTEGGRVEDGLLQKGLEYMKKREELKRKQDLEQQAEMTGKPQVSKYANMRAASRDPNETIVDRAAIAVRIKKEKDETLRREIEEREQSELQGRPTITKKSQKLNRNVNDMMEWETQRRARIEAKQAALEEQQASEHTNRPIVSTSKAVTDKLLKNRRDKVGEGVPIEERLQQYEEIRQWKRQQATEKADREARLAAKPNLVTRKHSKTASITSKNEKPPAEDWELEEEEWSDEEEYNLYVENMRRLQQLETDDQRSNGQSSTRSVSTGRVSGPSGQRVPGPSVADQAAERMYREAEQQQRRRATEVEQRIVTNSAYGPDGKPLFQPHLNKTSVKIAERVRGHDVRIEDLLFRKGQEREERMKRRMDRKLQEQKAQSNAPKINPTSEKIAREKEIVDGTAGSSRIDRLTRPIGSVKQTVLEGIEKPTFAPKISKKSAQLATQGHYFAAGRGARSGSSGKSRPAATTSYDFNREFSDNAGLRESAHEIYSSGNGYMHGDTLEEPGDHVGQAYGGGGTSNLYDRANSWAKEREIKIERDRQAREQEQLKDCTFRPRIQRAPSQDGLIRGRSASRERGGGSRERSGSAQPGRDYYESSSDSELRRGGVDDGYSTRQNNWARKRDLKLELERKRREKEELQSCSFAPDLRPQNIKGSPKQRSWRGLHEKPKTGKISLPAHIRESADALPRKQGSFSYETPYVQQNNFDGYTNGSMNYQDTYNAPSYGSATRLDFGEDDDTTYPSCFSANISNPNNGFMIESGGMLLGAAAPSGMGADNPPGEEYFDGDIDEYGDDEYGAEYELDESGDIINASTHSARF